MRWIIRINLLTISIVLSTIKDSAVDCSLLDSIKCIFLKEYEEKKNVIDSNKRKCGLGIIAMELNVCCWLGTNR